ncbi:MAG: radical SAM family heme chaperone HemW [Elusimicrobia bacterium]|nr:radical SAM family heme chaperone HemW [Elusimicrobiota bacterium]
MRGLYVHIPFCAVKCFYCDFTAFSGQRASTARYLLALTREANLHRGLDVGTLYIGGGTPSELNADETRELFGILHQAFGRKFSEITFEANPESLDEDKRAALKEAGVTRLSLGLQTADDKLLASIGRKHTWNDFRRVYDACAADGFSVNVDLMYALPGQTLSSSDRSVEQALALEPDHVSLYGLQVEDRTLFGKREVEVDEDLAREMFESALDRIEAAGLEHYEVSNFARPGKQSSHNRIYWNNGEYLGLGCGASSFLNGRRWANLDRLEPYCKAVENGGSPAAETETLSGKRALGETALLGLRLLEGLPWTPELEAAFPEERRHVVSRGWATLEAGRLRLTREGVFLANKVFAEFVEPFRTHPGAQRPDSAPAEVLQ